MGASLRQTLSGTTAEFGPLDNSETCASVKGKLDKFFTYFDLYVSRDGGVVVAVVADIIVEPSIVVALTKVLVVVEFERPY